MARHTAIVRLHAAISVQPHCRKAIRPADLFTIPGYDDREEPQPAPVGKDEARRRFEQLMKERNLTQCNGQQVDNIDNV